VTAGLLPRSARALAEAGCLSLADLEGVTREELLAIPGVGASTLEILEELLARPLAREGKGRVPPRPRPLWPEEVWRKRGLPPTAAIAFAQVGMTLERLGDISREELLGMPGVGSHALRICELMIGKEIRSHRLNPIAAFWKGKGLSCKTAGALSQAGIASPEELRKLSREELLSLPGIGDITIHRLEALLGSKIPSRTETWLSRGLALPIANALAREGINSLEALGRLTREQFLAIRGLGYYALGQCQKLLGRRLPSQPIGRDGT